ncbi:hypothetical protein GCM10023331_24490 [Algivirga pacifica]|uniref:PAS domain S-box-containing protein n=2 Tax=Algivirga pacifica TaxID=1162670 RepID=A0ABP9DB96_9BACT
MLSVLAISYLSYIKSKESVEEKYSDTFKVIGNTKVEQIDNYFKRISTDIIYMSKSRLIVNGVKQLRALPSFKDPAYYELNKSLYYELLMKKSVNGYQNIVLIDHLGKVLYTTYRFPSSLIQGERNKDLYKCINQGDEELYFSAPFEVDKDVYMYVLSPLIKTKGVKLGYVAILVNLSKHIFPIVENRTGLGSSGEVQLFRKHKSMLTFINDTYHDAMGPLDDILFDSPNNEAAKRAVNGSKGDFGFDIDYRGVKTLAYADFIPSVKWGLVVKMDYDEIQHGLDGLVFMFIVSSFVIILISTLIAVIFSQYLTQPIQSLKSKLKLLSRGILPAKIEDAGADEIGEMTLALKEVVQAMERTVQFAGDIEQGRYSMHYNPLSEEDLLGNALLAMRDSIQKSEQEDTKRGWVMSGVTEVGEILRNHQGLEEVGQQVTAFLCQKTQALISAFYVVEGEEREGQYGLKKHEGQEIRMVASHAYGKRKFMQTAFKFGEGLVGQSAIEQSTLLRTEVPDNYTRIVSGILGMQKPRNIMIVPLVSEQVVYGVLELGSFQVFREEDIELVEELSVIIARSIHNIRMNERTYHLWQESQKMSGEMKQQQLVLQDNASQMEHTQRELKTINQQLNDKISEARNSQKRMQLLLENAAEVIIILNEQGVVKYSSPSVRSMWGYSKKEIDGKSLLDFTHEDSRGRMKEFLDVVVQMNQEESMAIKFECLLKDGGTIWLETKGTNLLADAAVQGIVINARNITEERRAAKERRMRDQMQALSENSPDLILRVNLEGVLFYVNPAVRQYMQQPQTFLIGTNLNQGLFPDPVVTHLQYVLEKVKQEKEKQDTEFTFPTSEGDRIMHLVTIPEFNEWAELESVLFVAHDVTVRKQTELELLMKNRKVNESINYAKRIQGAILPDITSLKKQFTNSFVLFQPKDVVSGDFLWHYRRGDIFYVAVVDCTGHGVPGAFMSLVGSFTLNYIMQTNEGEEANVVLDRLHEEVVRVMQQDHKATAQDGMDAALLRFDFKNRSIQYAGAHRPLYVYDSDLGILQQYKGDRMSIGGGDATNRKSFTQHKLSWKSGLELYMFSDGIPDQFGGDENRKFGLKRLRERLTTYRYATIGEKGEALSNDLQEWKKEQKQTDDMLMVGLKVE